MFFYLLYIITYVSQDIIFCVCYDKGRKSAKEVNKMSYCEKMRALRIDRDLPQKEIAAVLGISQQYYSEYENGKRKLPIDHLQKLCKYYHVSADYILGLPQGLDYPKR